jgi:hypothetical protein
MLPRMGLRELTKLSTRYATLLLCKGYSQSSDASDEDSSRRNVTGVSLQTLFTNRASALSGRRYGPRVPDSVGGIVQQQRACPAMIPAEDRSRPCRSRRRAHASNPGASRHSRRDVETGTPGQRFRGGRQRRLDCNEVLGLSCLDCPTAHGKTSAREYPSCTATEKSAISPS